MGLCCGDTATGKEQRRLFSYRSVDAVAFSPDSKQLALAGRDRVTLWDTATGKEQHRLFSYRSVDAIAFSPDGKQLALAGRYRVILWDTITGKEQYRLDSYRGVAFSPDGKQLASTGRDGVILWDTATGKEQHRLFSYHSFDNIAFSPDGKQLALAGRDGVILWDTATGKEQHRLFSYRSVDAIAFSPDGKQLASASTDQTTSWDATAPTLAKSKLSGKKKGSYNLDETEDTKEVHVLPDTCKPMAQVQDALSYIGEGQHTVNVHADWQLQEYVHDGLDEPQDLATVLTITGEQEQAYACSCETYVNFAWGKNISIPEFFRAFAASGFAAKARKYPPFRI